MVKEELIWISYGAQMTRNAFSTHQSILRKRLRGGVSFTGAEKRKAGQDAKDNLSQDAIVSGGREITLAIGPMIHSESPHKRLRKLMDFPMVRILEATPGSMKFGSKETSRRYRSCQSISS